MDAKTYIEEFCAKNDWPCECPDDFYETLMEGGDIVYTEDIGSRRWWNDVFCVCDLDGRLIGFDSAETTGDNSPADVGWEFDINTICDVEKKEEVKTIISYIKK